MLNDAYKIIESLRAELFKSRVETQTALGEKEKAESECLNCWEARQCTAGRQGRVLAAGRQASRSGEAGLARRGGRQLAACSGEAGCGRLCAAGTQGGTLRPAAQGVLRGGGQQLLHIL